MNYPKDFLWGVSTAAAQIEGGASDDGRSPSIWDIFAQKHKVVNAKYFPTTCNSYHLFARDLENLKKLGVNSYRMSISWSRVLPEGKGKLNTKGIDYYKQVFDGLLSAGIQPNVTLYHWDLPQVLEEKGGWTNRDCIEWFGEYAEKMFRLYSDVVPYWATVNEPNATYIGYAKGKFAPGRKDEKSGNQARHNLLVAHGRGVQAFRAVADRRAKIGIVIDIMKRYPKRLTQRNLDVVKDEDERDWKFYIDAVFGNGYSEYILSELEKEGSLMDIAPYDYQSMQESIDFYGLNFYKGKMINKGGQRLSETEKSDDLQICNGKDTRILYDTVQMMREKYSLKIPIFITENGLQKYVCEFPCGGMIRDEKRIRYLKSILQQIERANADGMNIGGYYVWTLMDNFEWCAGKMMRFGLLHTNFKTFETTWKKSAYFYRDYIKTHKS